MPKGFKRTSRTLLASAGLVTASLMMPAPASAQQDPYNAWCAQYFKNWCANHWQADGFASFSECWTFYKELQCRYEW